MSSNKEILILKHLHLVLQTIRRWVKKKIVVGDKEYAPEAYSGLGHSYLKKNLVGNGFSEMLPFDGFVDDVKIENFSPVMIPDFIFFDRSKKYFVASQLGSSALKYYRSWSDSESSEPNAGKYMSPSGETAYSYDGNTYIFSAEKGLKESGGEKKNILTQDMINKPNTIYHIQYDYDLNGAEITIPEGCTLEFDGGSLRNGVLVGTLLTSDGFIDLHSLGVVYNNSASAAANANALNILSGVTNEVKLKVSGEFWIGGSNSVNIEYLNIDGNGNTIHIDGFSGFIVTKGASIRNCRVVTEAWATSKNFFNQFVKVQNVTSPIDVLFDGNYFKGSMRILSAYEIADGVTENNEFISTNYDVCLNSLIISNNIFEEICCGVRGNFLFMCNDSNIINISIYNNTIHNFFAEFAGFGITNDSIYVEYINDFYKHTGRNFNIINNNVSNDIDFKPWTKINQPTAYFCFVLAEEGNCNYSENSVANVIGNDANNAVYDAYLSVDVLTYENNIIKNVLNIAGAYNQILKSKGGRGVQKLRKYIGNRFTLEDLSQEFDVDVTALPYSLINTASVIQDYVIENNFIDFCTLTLNVNNLLSATKLYVRDNVFKINKAITSANNPALFPISSYCEYAVIKNNAISVSSSSIYLPYLFGGMPNSAAKVQVSENHLTNMSLYIGASSIMLSGKCTHNTYSVDGSTLSKTNSRFSLQNFDNTSIVFSENEVTVSNVPGNDATLCRNPVPFDIKVKRTLTTSMVAIYKINTNMRAIVKIKDSNGLLVGLHEFLINMADSSTAELTAFDSNGNYVSGTSSRTNLFNFAGTGNYLQISKNFTLISTPTEFTLKLEMFSDTKLTMFPQKGTTAKRPTSALDASNVGVTYFDTTLGKTIYWNGTKWADEKNMTAGVHKGNTEYRGGMPIGTLTEADWYGALDSTPEFNGFKNGVAQTQGDAAGTGTPHAIYFDRIRGKFLFESEDPNIPGNYLYWEKWVGSTYTPFVNPAHGTIYKENDNYWKYIAPKTNATLKLDPATDIGYEYFDTDLGKMVYAKNIAADGTASWVDANGMSC